MSGRVLVFWGYAWNRLAIPRSVFYACAVGGCEFFDYGRNESGEVTVLRREDLPEKQMTDIGL